MSFEADGEDYLSDGVYASWWNWKLEDNLPDEADDSSKQVSYAKKEDSIKTRILKRKILLLLKTSKSKDQFKEKLFHLVIENGLHRMAVRYCKLESLPSDYAVVALQNYILVDVIEQHLEMLSMKISDNELVALTETIAKVYNHKSTVNVYSRVGLIQAQIHHLAQLHWGVDGVNQLCSETMRKLLSLTRLHLNVGLLRTGKIKDIVDEIKLNHQSKQIDSKVPEYLKMLGKNIIKNWKVRHHKTLIFFALPEERKFLQCLLSCDEGNDAQEFHDQLPLYLLEDV